MLLSTGRRSFINREEKGLLKQNGSSEDKGLSLEIKRQIFHLFLLSLWMLPILLFPFFTTLTLMLLVISVNWLVVKKVKPVYNLFKVFIDHLERNSNLDRPGIQALYANVGVAVSFILFGELSLVGVVTLAVGDSVSTLIGKAIGKNRLFFNEGKTWEGTIAFFLTTCLALSSFMDFKKAVVVAFAGAIAEAIDMPVDDNLVIPVLSTCLAYLVW